MFNSVKRLSTSSDTPCDTIVGSGSVMKGEIVCKGPSKIAGHVDGELKGDDRIVIGTDAIVTGMISASEIEIDGQVTGIINAERRVILNETAIVEGDLNSPSVVIEEGAVFNGKSSMPNSASADSKSASDAAANIHALDIVAEKNQEAKAS